MSDDPEQRLRALRLARPSAELDRRMDDLFAAATNAPVARPGWWFALMAPLAGVAAALAIFTMQAQRPAPVPPPLVCRIEPAGLMREMLVPATPTRLPVFDAIVDTGETSP